MSLDWKLIAEVATKALSMIEKLVGDARHSGDIEAALSGIEDVFGAIGSNRLDPTTWQQALDDLVTLQKALTGSDAAADRALREKFGNDSETLNPSPTAPSADDLSTVD